MTDKHIIRPEYRVDLFREEIELLLSDVHVKLASLLLYVDLGNRVMRDNLNKASVIRHITILRNLAAKLELAISDEQTK